MGEMIRDEWLRNEMKDTAYKQAKEPIRHV